LTIKDVVKTFSVGASFVDDLYEAKTYLNIINLKSGLWIYRHC